MIFGILSGKDEGKGIFTGTEFVVISAKESRDFETRLNEAFAIVTSCSFRRSRAIAGHSTKESNGALVDQPTAWRGIARCSTTRQRKRPKKDRDAHRALPRWTPRFSPRDRKRRGSRARNSAISAILSLHLHLSLSPLTVYIAAIDRGDRSCGIRSSVVFHNRRFLHTYTPLFSVRV